MIIGITGYKYNGKDTCANYLVDNYKFNKISFADPLKQCLKSLFSFTDEQLYGKEKEIVDNYWGVSPRTVMQFVGTELFRDQMKQIIFNIDSMFWCKVMERKLSNICENVVIADVRFVNEALMIKKMNG